jgi:hypothetical protein
MKVTIVSACDRNYFLGAFLLAASAARYLPEVPFNLLQTGFGPEERNLLNQFPNVRILELSAENRRNVCNRKHEALLTADTEYIAWFDADCMIIGNIGPLLKPHNHEFQIRLREPWENAWVWRHHYSGSDKRGGLPAAVLTRWQKDVAQLELPRLSTTCVTNGLVIHRRHLDFIREWSDQIAKVLPDGDTGVVDSSLDAYFMLDESVLSSLLAFSRMAPPISDFRLNRDPAAHIAHFGAHPKPWKRWRKHLWYCHRHVLDLLGWVGETGRVAPPIPWSFRRSNRVPAYLLTLGEEGLSKLRATVKSFISAR